MELIVFLYPDRLVFEVCDTGQAMGEFPKAEMDFDSKDLKTVPEGGMGLYLMQSLMDHVSYETINGRNILRMTKYFKGVKEN